LDHTQLQLQCIRSYSSLQFTITLAESSHCFFTGCLSSNIAGSGRLQLSNYSLKTDARPEYSLVTRRNSNSNSVDKTGWLAGALGYIARKQTTKKTLPPTPPLLHDVIAGTDPKENTHCCIGYSVFIRCHSNTCHIAYSMHLTILSNEQTKQLKNKVSSD
jgi:hypothetical protein